MDRLMVINTLNPNILAAIVATAAFSLIGVAFFVTQIKEMLNHKNREQVENSSLLKNILDSSIEYSIIALDLEGKILTWNAGARHNYGYEAQEVVGVQNVKILYYSTGFEGEHFQGMLDTALREGKAEGLCQRIRKNGDVFLALVTISLRLDAQQKPQGYLLISKDVTEQKRMDEQVKVNQMLDEQNKQIQEVNRLKNEFLANMSHELRTPLNAVIGFSELIYDKTLGPINEDQKEALGDIVKSAKQLLKIISDLLDLAKVESGRMEFNPQKINMKKLVNEVLASFEMMFAKKKIKLTADIDAAVNEVFLDPARFKQILFNLISNAHKFTPELGQVRVRVLYENTRFFRVEVEDSGIGIKSGDINKLFTAFTQLDSSVSKKYQGTGLGLSLTKQIAEAQGGRVGVVSMPNKGSIFYALIPKCYLPVGEGRSLAVLQSDVSVSAVADVPETRSHVVVIDDDPLSLKLMGQWLKDKDCQCHCFSDAELGLEAVISHKPDVVVLDLMMAKINGFEFLRRLKEADIGKQIPVIIWTAKDLTAAENEILQQSAQAIILKGIGASTKQVLMEIERITKNKT